MNYAFDLCTQKKLLFVFVEHIVEAAFKTFYDFVYSDESVRQYLYGYRSVASLSYKIPFALFVTLCKAVYVFVCFARLLVEWRALIEDGTFFDF